MLLFVQPSGNPLHGGPIYACGGVNGTMKKYIWKHTAKIETAAATLQNGAVRNTASTQSLL